MASRLQDLISTADKQLASRSYDAAIDNYRTALSEPGAVEAGVDNLLETACRARDAALGVARPAEPPAQPAPLNVEVVAPQRVEPPTDPRVEPDPAPPVDDSPIEPPGFHLIEDDPSMLERSDRHGFAEVVAPQPLEPPADPRAEPDPAPPVDDSPIEPPGFHLIEDDPSMLERSDRHAYVEPKPLSILDPTPLPEEPDNMGLARIGVAALITFIVCGALFYASFGRRITPRSSLMSGVTTPVLEFKTDPEYTPEARQARIQGTVMLDVEIEPDGSATVQRVTKGLDPELDRRAIEAVSKWRFRPAMKNGRPVKTVAHVVVNFRLL